MSANAAIRSAKLNTGWPTRVGLCATFATLFFATRRCDRACARGFARETGGFVAGLAVATTGAVLTDSLTSARSATACGGRFFAAARARW